VHPLRVESVAWATERRDVLCGVFYLLAVHLYLRYWERRLARDRYERRWYAGSVACHAAALLSKSMAVTLPVLLLLLDVYPLRRLGPRAGGWFEREQRPVWAEKLPFAVLSAGAGIGALIALGSFGISRARSLTELGLGGRAAVSAYSLAFYLGKTVWPVDLGPLYEFPLRVSAPQRPPSSSPTATPICRVSAGPSWPGRRRRCGGRAASGGPGCEGPLPGRSSRPSSPRWDS
jgi:hypothetical protein